MYGLPVSMRDQELHFESFLMAFEDEDWFYGPGFFWVHFGPGDQMGGINDVSMTFRCKPAEEVMARYYNPVWTPPLNRQDGSTEDWPDTALFIDDLPGDSAGEDEILSFASYEDDKYVRFAIRYSERPLGNFTIWLDATGDGKADYLLSSGPTIPDFPVEVFFRSSAFGDWSRTEMLGAADSATVGGTVEIRLNKVFMPEDCDGALTVWLEDHNAEWSALDDAIKGHHIIPVIPSEEEG